MIRSIRVTMTLWYVGLLAVILVAFSAVLYTTLARSLLQKIDEVLTSQADGITDAIFAFWHAEHARRRHEAPPTEQSFERDIAAGRLAELVWQWAAEVVGSEAMHPCRVLTRDGTSLYTSSRFARSALPITAAALQEGQSGQTVFETFRTGEGQIRLITRPETTAEGDVLYLVQTMASLHQSDLSLDHLRSWLLWSIPITLVITSVGGWFLASRALAPVDHIVAKVRRISAERLHERVDVPPTADELARLAITFNHMMERLEEAFKRLRQFSAAASHELRTPLTVMKGELELALRRPRSLEEYQTTLRTHLEAVNDISRTVSLLLTLARSETGEGVIEWQQVNLTDLARRVGEAMRGLAQTKQVQLVQQGDAAAWVRGEPRLLESLLMNLVDNALKHTPTNGIVTLQTAQREGEVILCVQDTGPGIPPDLMPRLFDQFFHRPARNIGLSSGIGLGLSRWIVEAHRGSIDVTSAPGSGATFTVRLPLAS